MQGPFNDYKKNIPSKNEYLDLVEQRTVNNKNCSEISKRLQRQSGKDFDEQSKKSCLKVTLQMTKESRDSKSDNKNFQPSHSIVPFCKTTYKVSSNLFNNINILQEFIHLKH